MDNTTTRDDTDPRLLRLNPSDNVAVAITAIEAGESVVIGGRPVTLPAGVPTGHKLALVAVATGEKVLKYGSPIGSATAEICPGDYVHTHNLKSDYLPTYTLDGENSYFEGA